MTILDHKPNIDALYNTTAHAPIQMTVHDNAGRTTHRSAISLAEAERAERMKKGPLPQPDLIRALGDIDADTLSRNYGDDGKRNMAQLARDMVPTTLAVTSFMRDHVLDPETQKYVSAVLRMNGPDAAESFMRIARDLQTLPIAERRPALKAAYREIGRENREARQRRAEIETDLQLKRRVADAIDDMLAWAATNPPLRRADGSKLRDLRKALRENKAEAITADNSAKGSSATDFEKEVFTAAEPMVVTHDWAAAFAGSNLATPEIKLPYDVCAFEFQYGDRRVIAIATEANESVVFAPFIEQQNGHWLVVDFAFDVVHDNEASITLRSRPNPEAQNACAALERIMTSVANQIVAICVALDAEVAITEAVREPHTGQHGKNFHAPLRTYHVVSLGRRTRLARLESSEPTGVRRRLHFRRGHWRHFEAHKTWIKWMLVGDPDLGWVEKEYRL